MAVATAAFAAAVLGGCSLRGGEGSIAESYAAVEADELWLINSHIPEYSHGNRLNHEPRRPRKLLLHRKEIDRLASETAERGFTLVHPYDDPLVMAGQGTVGLEILAQLAEAGEGPPPPVIPSLVNDPVSVLVRLFTLGASMTPSRLAPAASGSRWPSSEAGSSRSSRW